MKCLFFGFLPQGSEWIIISLFVLVPIYYLVFKLINEFIRYLRRK